MFSSVTTDRAPAGVMAIGGDVGCSEDVVLGIPELAARAPWSAAEVLALPGRCRGSVLARWAALCRRRFGEAAVQRVRAELGPLSADLPDDPPDDAWFPVAVQIRLTDVVVAEFLGGDPSRLQPLLADDVARQLGRAAGMFLRAVGPAPVLARAKQIHPSLYDVGRARTDVRSTQATIHCEGARLFANPTWQILQLMAHAGFVELTGRRVVSLGATMPADDALRIDVRWE